MGSHHGVGPMDQYNISHFEVHCLGWVLCEVSFYMDPLATNGVSGAILVFRRYDLLPIPTGVFRLAWVGSKIFEVYPLEVSQIKPRRPAINGRTLHTPQFLGPFMYPTLGCRLVG